MRRFLRTKHELDKEAILKEATDAAREIPGVRVATGGEDFVVEPVSAPELAPAVAR